jgi:putative chitinase
MLEFNFTENMLKQMLPSNQKTNLWYVLLMDFLPRYNVNTKDRLAAFVAQTAHESNEYRTLEENLNYSWEALRSIFPRYFPTDEIAMQYHRRPEMIANCVYFDKNRISKLGNVEEGDGWRFRGKGLIQLTGRHNVEEFAKSINMTAEEASSYLETEEGAMASACWFWTENNCNDYVDAGDIEGLSKRINGGTIGLKDRIKKWNKNIDILNHNYSKKPTSILRRGARGDSVKLIQHALNITADGIFGPGTESTLIDWQEAHKLVPDGIAGPSTYKVMF